MAEFEFGLEDIDNPLIETSIRYGGFGGIAYHYISDTYVALFSRFIPCGVWEAVHLIEGLLANTSDIQPTTVHADTQGQNFPVFALATLFGFDIYKAFREFGRSVRTVALPANLVVFHNALDISDIVRRLVAEGRQITADQLGRIAPYLRAHISRFGAYATDELRPRPDPFDPLLKEVDFADVELAA